VIDEPTSPTETGPSACPFVAFEDDRDHRSSSPDYRHRCFAATEPEPRAFPHQERYCLSAGFAGCPVFLDWARQEAAAVRADHPVTPAAVAASAGAAAVAGAAALPAGAVDASAPAFLASRTRPAGDLTAVPADRRTLEAGATLWTYDTEMRRSNTPAAPPPPSSLGAPAVAMARRGPSHPGWENPPRLENFPRLRSRDERRANEPLLVAAVGVALIMVALVLFPILTSPRSGGGLGNGGGSTPAALDTGAIATPTEEPSPTATPAATLPDGWFLYRVLPGDYIAKIAQKFNLQVWEVELANPQITNFDYLQVGWSLKIPPPNLLTPPPSLGP